MIKKTSFISLVAYLIILSPIYVVAEDIMFATDLLKQVKSQRYTTTCEQMTMAETMYFLIGVQQANHKAGPCREIIVTEEVIEETDKSCLIIETNWYAGINYADGTSVACDLAR
jgi:hypothetical protein